MNILNRLIGARIYRTAPIILCLLAVQGCATSPLGRSQLTLMPESQMNQMGLQAFDQFKKGKPIEQSPTVNRYVHCVANAIIRNVGGDWEVVVFKDETPNAFALPSRKIGVHTGLLKVATNQDQLAAVLGHEVAHVLANHSNERVSQKFAVSQGLNLLGALASPQSGTGQTLMGLLGMGAQYGILLPFSRTHEAEADVVGLDLMAKAGFDPRQSVDLWMNMDRASKGQQPPEFASTHPSHTTRIDGLKRAMPDALGLYTQAKAAGRASDCGLPPAG